MDWDPTLSTITHQCTPLADVDPVLDLQEQAEKEAHLAKAYLSPYILHGDPKQTSNNPPVTRE